MKSLKKFLQGGVLLVLFIIVSLGVFLGFCISISWMIEKILIPEDFTLWVIKDPYSKIPFLFEFIIMFGIYSLYTRIKDRNYKNKGSLVYKVWSFMKGRMIIVSVLLLGMLYLFCINIICIKDETIIFRGTFNPSGKEYSLKDVSKVETGFGGSKKFYGASKGTFYYIITLKDGKKFDINDFSSDGSKYGEDTYLSIEEIDKNIMESNPDVVKISSLDYYEYAGLAQQYIDRFQRIIENKR